MSRRAGLFCKVAFAILLALALTPVIGTQTVSAQTAAPAGDPSGAATFTTTFLAWWMLRAAIGIRVTPDAELEGLDASEHGVEAYAAFVKVSQE